MTTWVREGPVLEVAGLEIVPVERTTIGCRVEGESLAGFATKDPVELIVRSSASLTSAPGSVPERIWILDRDGG